MAIGSHNSTCRNEVLLIALSRRRQGIGKVMVGQGLSAGIPPLIK